jgi:hypothetical protein
MTGVDANTAAAFAAGAALGAAALYLYQRSQRNHYPLSDTGLHHEGPVWRAHKPHHHHAGQASVADFQDDDILVEQLTRNVQFFGLEAQQRIARAFVVVVGLGVSEAAWALCCLGEARSS